MVEIPIKTVLQMVQYHAEGNYEAFKQLAVDLAFELDQKDESELSQFILAQYGLIPTWSPM